MECEAVIAFPPAVSKTRIPFDNESRNVHLLEASCDLQTNLPGTDYDNIIDLQDLRGKEFLTDDDIRI